LNRFLPAGAVYSLELCSDAMKDTIFNSISLVFFLEVCVIIRKPRVVTIRVLILLIIFAYNFKS